MIIKKATLKRYIKSRKDWVRVTKDALDKMQEDLEKIIDAYITFTLENVILNRRKTVTERDLPIVEIRFEDFKTIITLK